MMARTAFFMLLVYEVTGHLASYLVLLQLLLAGFGAALLQLQQLRVDAARARQCLRCTGLVDMAVPESNDLIDALDSTQPVRNDQRGTALHQALQCLLHHMLALAVQAGGSFVQYENWCIFQQCPGYGNALLLPAR